MDRRKTATNIRFSAIFVLVGKLVFFPLHYCDVAVVGFKAWPKFGKRTNNSYNNFLFLCDLK